MRELKRLPVNYPDPANIAWQFDTNNIRVIFHTEPEFEAPDFDDDGQVEPSADLGDTFKAYDADNCVWTRVRGWQWSFEQIAKY